MQEDINTAPQPVYQSEHFYVVTVTQKSIRHNTEVVALVCMRVTT